MQQKLPLDCLALIAEQAPLITVIQMKRAIRQSEKIKYPNIRTLICKGFERAGFVEPGRGDELFRAIFEPSESDAVWLSGSFLLWIVTGDTHWKPDDLDVFINSDHIHHSEVMKKVSKVLGLDLAVIDPYWDVDEDVSFDGDYDQDNNHIRCIYTMGPIQFIFFNLFTDEKNYDSFDEWICDSFDFAFCKITYAFEEGLHIHNLSSILHRHCSIRRGFYHYGDDVDGFKALNGSRVERRRREKYENRNFSISIRRSHQ
jgi:hypothetical protein